jgi:pyrroline-5-carboxylate reductase
MKSLSIVGCGNLGVSLVNGLLESKTVEPKQFHLARRNTTALAPLKDQGCFVYTENNKCVSQSDVIILGVLPQKINAVLEEIKDSIDESKLIVSLVSSVTITEIKEVLGANTRVVRAMPNTAIAIRESMTCISGESQDDIDLVNDLFKNVGETMVINEEQMTSATALCACGIAFFLRAIRAASQGGNQIDFHASEALKMAAQTAKGAASLLLHNNTHPEEEIDKVTSPKGCTIAGLNEMEHEGFSSAFIKGIVLSAERAKGLY